MLHIIHLPHRTDRLALLIKELERQEILDYRIWPRIKTIRPSFGIAMAHQQVVKWAIQENLPEITIAEDDVLFTALGAFTYYLQSKPSTFDLYLAGITYGELLPDNTVNDFAGTHLYTIHQNFYTPFLDQKGKEDIDRK
jgi:GR25 family glycosyltransferase involved in LPS biosynthesis